MKLLVLGFWAVPVPVFHMRPTNRSGAIAGIRKFKALSRKLFGIRLRHRALLLRLIEKEEHEAKLPNSPAVWK